MKTLDKIKVKISQGPTTKDQNNETIINDQNLAKILDQNHDQRTPAKSENKITDHPDIPKGQSNQGIKGEEKVT